MATCNKCKCEAKYCGCADKAQPVAPPCTQGTSDCPMPETCSEIFSAECIVYDGNDMPEYGINKGDRLDDIIQRIVLYQFNAACAQPYTGVFPGTPATCSAVTGLRSDWITANDVKLVWTASSLANSYVIEYKRVADPGWTTLYAITNPANQYTTKNTYYTVGGLTPNTLYYFRVISKCVADTSPCSGSGCCTSVIIRVKTSQ